MVPVGRLRGNDCALLTRGACRTILDEAHNIKERSTNAAKAAFALDSKYKWCLSGTPLQNRVGELYSLIRFLGGDREQGRLGQDRAAALTDSL